MSRHYIFRALFTVAALVLLAGYLFGPRTLASRFDTMAFGLLGLAALPWLGALVEEFKIGGVEAKLRAIREEAQEAMDTATNAREVAEELVLTKDMPRLDQTEAEHEDLQSKDFAVQPEQPPEATSDTAEAGSAQDTVKASKPPRTHVYYDPIPAVTFDPAVELKKLAEKYIDKRKKMTPGAMRTAMMTNVFADMQAVAMTIEQDDGTITGWMKGDDDGLQLAAIAWLRNYPAAMPPSAYIDLIERTTQPFVQYWGLRALSGRISALGLQDFSIADRITLKEMESLMRAGTDRHVQIRRINRKLSG